jgi:hypothetical protein
MNMKEDHVWESLLAQSRPAFAGETDIPFGLTTRVLAALRDQQKQEAVLERTGRRAIFASLAAVLGMALFTFFMAHHQADETDPGVQSMALVENVQVS